MYWTICFVQIRYCYGFAEQGVCRSQDNCSFPHWTYDVVQEMARELNMKPMSQKKSRGVCFMFARTGSCNAGFACSYAHTPNAAVQRNLSAKTKFPKVKGSPVLPRDEYSEQLAKHMLMIQNKRVRWSVCFNNCQSCTVFVIGKDHASQEKFASNVSVVRKWIDCAWTKRIMYILTGILMFPQ